MAALYKIANSFAALMNEGLEPELIADTVDGIEGEFTDKVESLLAIIKNKNAYAKALKVEADSLAARAKAVNNQTEGLKQYIAHSLKTMDKKKITAGLHTVTIRKPVQVLKIADASKLPVDLVDISVVHKAKTTDIKNLLKSGEKVEGATLEDGKESISIK